MKNKAVGYWLNGEGYEYEFAYCSVCGRMEYAGWDTNSEAEEQITEFHKEHKYCPNCGTRMEGGKYQKKIRREKRQRGKRR